MKFSSLQRNIALLGAAVSLAFSSHASAAPIAVDITGTEAIFQFDAGLRSVNLPLLTGKHTSGVKITALDSTFKSRTLRLPIKGGTWDLDSGVGQIRLGGGLVYTRTAKDPVTNVSTVTKVTLSDLIVDITFQTSFVAPTGNPPPPRITTIIYGTTVSALMTVNGAVSDRIVFWNLPVASQYVDDNEPLNALYKKLNLGGGVMLPIAPGTAALTTALGTPVGFDAGTPLLSLNMRTTFKTQ